MMTPIKNYSRRGLAGLLAASAMFCLLATPVRAADGTADDPRAFVQGLGDQVIAIIKSPGVTLPERQRRFHDLFTQSFDADAIGRFVLGQSWNRASDEARKSYVALFGDYVAAIYAIQFSHYDGASFKTASVGPIGNGDQAVNAEIDQPQKPPLQVVFRVRATPQGPKIVDVAVDAVSLIVTKRQEFAEILAKEGLEGIMRRMRTVLDNTRSAAE
jgi:phospholipid transport system substrate-binding protein